MGKPVEFSISIFILLLAGVVAFNTFSVYSSADWDGDHQNTVVNDDGLLTVASGQSQGTYTEQFTVSESVTLTNITFDGVDAPNTTLMTATIKGIDGGSVTTSTTIGITEDGTESFELAEPVETVEVSVEMMRGDGVAPTLGFMTLQARQPTLTERVIGFIPYQTQGMAILLSTIILGGTVLWLRGV